MIILVGAQMAFANVTLSPLFCDHMVLQREISVAVWGRSGKVAVTITPSCTNNQFRATTESFIPQWQSFATEKSR